MLIFSKQKIFFKKALALALTATTLAVSLIGCSNSKEAGNVKKIIIGSGNSYNPYCYIDENGKAVGYEYDVLAAIDELLPQYEFEYKSLSFDQILLSLESGKIDGATSATTQILKNYNEAHKGSEVVIVNTESSTDEEAVAALKNGADRAIVLKKSDLKKYNTNFSDGQGDWLKAVGEPVNNSLTYYLYKQGNEQLKNDIDGALKTLKENGKLSELAIKWVGYDVTESE